MPRRPTFACSQLVVYLYYKYLQASGHHAGVTTLSISHECKAHRALGLSRPPLLSFQLEQTAWQWARHLYLSVWGLWQRTERRMQPAGGAATEPGTCCPASQATQQSVCAYPLSCRQVTAGVGCKDVHRIGWTIPEASRQFQVPCLHLSSNAVHSTV